MRSPTFEYEPIWEAYTDWGKWGLTGDFTLFCVDVCWEAGYFTFHLALLGFHIGRSLQIKLTLVLKGQAVEATIQ